MVFQSPLSDCEEAPKTVYELAESSTTTEPSVCTDVRTYLSIPWSICVPISGSSCATRHKRWCPVSPSGHSILVVVCSTSTDRQPTLENDAIFWYAPFMLKPTPRQGGRDVLGCALWFCLPIDDDFVRHTSPSENVDLPITSLYPYP